MLTHKFDVQSKHKLDNEKRREELPPYQTLESLGLKEGNIVADIGCGIGYFTMPAAEIAGASSKVFAMDISIEMLEEVERKALDAGLTNIRGIKTDEYDLKADDCSVDFIIVSNVLHEIEDKEKFIDEIFRILKPSGRLAIIEWQKIAGEYGPPIGHRLAQDEVCNFLTGKDFESIQKVDISPNYYGITADKS